MIESLQNFPANVAAFACTGHVSRADYETVLIPRVEQALAEHEKVRLYYEIGPTFNGIDPAAIWSDFKVGMEHLTRWERIAIVTDVAWIKTSIMFFSFMMPGATKTFSLAEAEQARAWIAAL